MFGESTASFKGMSKTHKLFFNEDAKTIESSIEGINDDFTETHNLWDSVKGIHFFEKNMIFVLNNSKGTKRSETIR